MHGGASAAAGGGGEHAPGGGISGNSTPMSAAPGMSIDEFKIIKPVSRGAFGRVYLARKLATGDLFAIKVWTGCPKNMSCGHTVVSHVQSRPVLDLCDFH